MTGLYLAGITCANMSQLMFSLPASVKVGPINSSVHIWRIMAVKVDSDDCRTYEPIRTRLSIDKGGRPGSWKAKEVDSV